MDENLELSWGTVPAVIIDLARLLAKRASENAKRVERMKWPDGPGDVQEELRLAIGAAHKTTKASNDVRALLSAYAHKFHSPRPVISDLARAQETSSQGFIRRYSEGTVDAVASLLSPTPEIEPILLAFPSVAIADLVELGGTVGVEAKRLLDSREWDAKARRIRDTKVRGSEDL